MKILFTGPNGFIAKNLINYYSKFPFIKIIGVNKEDRLNEILYKEKPEIIIHTGAEIYNDDKMFEYNVLSSKVILDYCKNNTIDKLIIFGSSSEYGRKEKYISEQDFLDPTTLYEATKGMVSLLSQGYANTYNIPITVIRPFTIVGRYEKPHKLFPTLYRAYKKNEEIQITQAMHDYVFIDDFIQVFDIILNYKEKEFSIINIGSGKQTSNFDIVRSFEKVLDYKFDKLYKLQLRKFDSMNWVCNTIKLKTKYNIEINTSIEVGIKRFCEDCDQLNLYR